MSSGKLRRAWIRRVVTVISNGFLKVHFMGRRPARFTQADLNRAIRAITRAGANMVVEVLPDGTMRIAPAGSKAGERPRSEPERVVVL